MTKTQLVARVKELSKKFDLGAWLIEVVVTTIPDEGDKLVFATCTSTPEYRRAEIEFDLKKIKKHGESIDGTIKHELAHCHNARLESLVSSLIDENSRLQRERARQVIEESATALERMP